MSRQCSECGGAMKRFTNETFTVTYAGISAKVERLSGCRYTGCGEVAFDVTSALRYAATGDALVLEKDVA